MTKREKAADAYKYRLPLDILVAKRFRWTGGRALDSLRNTDDLRRACSDVVENAPTDAEYVQWGSNLREFLAEVNAADLRKRASAAFQRRIWEDNPVSSTGMGTVFG